MFRKVNTYATTVFVFIGRLTVEIKYFFVYYQFLLIYPIYRGIVEKIIQVVEDGLDEE